MEKLQAEKAKSQQKISKLSLIISIIFKKPTKNTILNLIIKSHKLSERVTDSFLFPYILSEIFFENYQKAIQRI